jgi:hypothetical protein
MEQHHLMQKQELVKIYPYATERFEWSATANATGWVVSNNGTLFPSSQHQL